MTSVGLIFLHGSGSCGNDVKTFLDVVPLPDFENRTFTQVTKSLSVDVLTPTAVSRPYSPMGGELCSVWFDRSPSFMREGMNDVEDLRGAEASLDMIMASSLGVHDRYSHVFIGGFSMGGGLALHALRRDGPPNLRGVFSMGSFAVQRSALVEGALGSNAKVPVLMMHGERDSMISCSWGRQTAAHLLLRGIDVQFRSYKGVDHDMDPRELADLLLWVSDLVQQQEASDKDRDRDKEGKGKIDAAQCKAERKGASPCDTAVGAKPAATKNVSSSSSGSGSRAEAKAGMAGTLKAEEDKGIEEELRQMQIEQQQRRVISSGGGGSGSVPSQESHQQHGALSAIEYTIEPADTYNTSSSASASAADPTPLLRVRYAVPRELIGVLAGRPVLACGSTFDILEDQPRGVQVLLRSSDPHSTARQIGARLQTRISGGSASLNPCPVS